MESEDLQKTLESFREDRLYRAKSMVNKLIRLGYKITWEEVLKVAGSGSVGRPHIAEILAETGQVASIKAAFDELLGRNGPAYTERRKMDPETAIELIVQHSGIPVLAHPREVNNLDEILPSLVSSGLKGMETYYGHYSTEERTRFQQLCDNHTLLATGGSDYHGPDRAAECDLGDSKTNLQVGKLLLKMHDELKI
jgi:predicted metal-dependent phosphoesterase TrpH